MDAQHTLIWLLIWSASLVGAIVLVWFFNRAKKTPPAPAPCLPTAGDLLQTLTTPAPACRRCKHFDLEEGQAIMRSQPHFLAAAEHLQPAEMGRTVTRHDERTCPECKGQKDIGTGRYTRQGDEILETCRRCNGEGTIYREEMSPPSAPYKASWNEFGACLNPAAAADGDGFITWGSDCCEHFEPKEAGDANVR